MTTTPPDCPHCDAARTGEPAQGPRVGGAAVYVCTCCALAFLVTDDGQVLAPPGLRRGSALERRP